MITRTLRFILKQHFCLCCCSRSVPLTVLGRINGTISGINASVDTLLTTLGRDGLLPVYGDVKGLVCCLVPDFMTSMWIGLSFAGKACFAARTLATSQDMAMIAVLVVFEWTCEKACMQPHDQAHRIYIRHNRLPLTLLPLQVSLPLH